MLPYGGSPRCPRCEKAVYAAEQVMGPGRKLYHKLCLNCTSCKRRLDSFNLLEHDEEPYCKNCHTRYFGTRDLRSGNLPHHSEIRTPPTSPPRHNSSTSTPPIKTWNPASPAALSDNEAEEEEIRSMILDEEPTVSPNKERRINDLLDLLPSGNDAAGGLAAVVEEETPEPTPTRTPKAAATPSRSFNSATVGRSNTTSGTYSAYSAITTREPLASSPANLPARNGAGATPVRAHTTGPAKWGSPGTNPVCPRCTKSVYFAEQVKAVGKTWHKGCLRCHECGTTLAAGKLADREGDPFCHRCYSKVHGPQGGGYALF